MLCRADDGKRRFQTRPDETLTSIRNNTSLKPSTRLVKQTSQPSFIGQTKYSITSLTAVNVCSVNEGCRVKRQRVFQ
jgi:hypothetical protein